jgi:superfamily II DNA or RNA helicase
MRQFAAEEADQLVRYAVVFEPADPPRTGTVAFWHPDGRTPPGGDAAELTVVVPRDSEIRTESLPAVRVPVSDALPVLMHARRPDHVAQAHPAAAFWGGAALLALHLIARHRLLPGVSADGFDAWRVGPFDGADVEHIRALAAAMPAEARAVPISNQAELPDGEGLIRTFLDAVADSLPRTPAASRVTGIAPFARLEPQPIPHLQGWAEELRAGIDSGVRISLRVESPEVDFTLEPFRAVVQVHSLADPTLVADAADLWRGAAQHFDGHVRIDTMLAVRRAARVWPPLERLLGLTVPDETELTDDEVQELLGDGGARLSAAGIDVHWPKQLVRALTAKAVVGKSEPPPSDLPAFFGTEHLLRFDWQLALGDQPLTDEEMDQLAESHRPVVRLRDHWVLVDPELARRARERALKPLSTMDALSAILTGTTEVDGERVPVATTGWLEALRQRIANPDSGPEPIDQPATLNATLREYQLRGLRWLHQMTSLGLGACLADDMGLGKTVTLIALHLHRQTDPATSGPTLVVCPASLLGNWEREVTRFAPGTVARRFHGTGRSLAALLDEVGNGFVLTTYGTMRLDVKALADARWALVVADEAQHVKNPLSRTAKALREITAGARVALTGTPVENNLSELWAILDWTTPGLLGTLSAFRSRWAKAVETGQDAAVAERLSRLIRPFLLRRRKSDPGIAPELPPKTDTDRPVPLTAEQAALYEAVVRETMAQIKASTGVTRRGLVLKLLTALKQICNHPAQYLKEPHPRLAGRSGKLELLDELVDTITAEEGAVLVFTQYVSMGRLLEKHLTDRGVPTQLLHGGTPVRRRENMVQRFQLGDVPVFLLSLKAAGTGLNLTRADHVIHYDRWWNPAVEEQASDRAYRIGQTHPVQVHRMIAEGTVEDRIATMLQSKRQLADAVLTAGEAALTELSDTELADLVELRSAR